MSHTAKAVSDKLSPKIEDMLLMDLNYLDCKLVMGIISQYGGEDAFFQNAERAATKGMDSGIPGFITDHEMIQFLATNKKELIELIASDAEIEDLGSCIECIATMGWFSGLKLDQVAEGLHDSSSELHTTIARGLTHFAGSILAGGYIDYKHRESLQVTILSNGWPHISVKPTESGMYF